MEDTEVSTMVAVKFNGRKLRSARLQRIMTHEELAEITVLNGGQIGRIERGQIKTPRMRTVRYLAAALEIDPFELFDNE